MYEEGTVIYFTPFYFENGNTAKPKYFIVLKNIPGKQLVLASLPTSKIKIPPSIEIKNGCTLLPEINLNFFCFKAKQQITECDNFFDFDTFIYGYQVKAHSLKILQENYAIEGADYELFGKLKPEIFEALIECLKEAKSVKNKYKKMLLL